MNNENLLLYFYNILKFDIIKIYILLNRNVFFIENSEKQCIKNKSSMNKW